ncbi:protein roadkill-like [Stegodyphus dumicola]|uniref:protein roadkill-like n=1 Tax=Stegodyphus dumicola TaxID=202533 RepID=UPI0015A99ECC|nr:protein roadkill-like [Stegodyphus dumicola]
MRNYNLHFHWYVPFGWEGLEFSSKFGPSNAWNLSFRPDATLSQRRKRLCLCRQRGGLKIQLEGYLITKSQGFINFEASMDQLSTFVFLPILYNRLVIQRDSYVTIDFQVTERKSSEEETDVNVKVGQTDTDFDMLDESDKLPTMPDVTSLSLLSRDMQTMYQKRHQSDFTLICGSNKIQVHKCILSARSPVFASMFQHAMTERAEKRMIIPNIDALVLDQLVLFMYTGRINELSYPMARDLYSASDQYAVLQLKDKCSEFLISSLCTSTAVEVLILGDMHNDIMLKNAATSYISDNFDELNTTEAWLTLVKERSPLAIEVLSSAVTQAKSEFQNRI